MRYFPSVARPAKAVTIGAQDQQLWRRHHLSIVARILWLVTRRGQVLVHREEDTASAVSGPVERTNTDALRCRLLRVPRTSFIDDHFPAIVEHRPNIDGKHLVDRIEAM